MRNHDNSNLHLKYKHYFYLLSKLTSNVESPDGGVGLPPGPLGSFNIARQRGPLGSERSPGPRQTSPNAEIHHDRMHARHLVSVQSFTWILLTVPLQSTEAQDPILVPQKARAQTN